MTKAKTILVSLSALTLLSTVASAQNAPYNVLNGQMQLNDVIGVLNVEMGTSNNVVGTATALGNNMAARAIENDMNVVSLQNVDGNVGAQSSISVANAHGLTLSNAVAAGNIAQLEGCCAVTTSDVNQVTAYNKSIDATSIVRAGAADAIVSATQSTGNSFAGWTDHGESYSFTGQYNSSNINANSDVGAEYNTHSVTSGAVAAANSTRLGGETATIYSTVDQKNFADVNALSRVNIGSANNVTSGAAGAGNLAEVQNKWGYVQMNGQQENNNAINAASVVQLGDWGGYAVSGANTIGNSALVSNIGSDVTMGITQQNNGNITSFAMLEGNSSRGGVGAVSSMATGNAMTGYSCSNCGDSSVKVEGYANQINNGNVTAATHVGVGTAGFISANATAIGNSATFIAQRGH